MKKRKKIIFLNSVGILLLTLPMIFCSGPSKRGKTVVKKNVVKTPVRNSEGMKDDNISKTTCTDCHKTGKKGDLIVSPKKLEGAKPPVKGGFAK